MDEMEINLKKEIGTDLGSRQKIESLFKNIPYNINLIIMNFEDIEFMSRTFAQEYLNQKHVASFEVMETNMPKSIKKMFKSILKLNNKI